MHTSSLAAGKPNASHNADAADETSTPEVLERLIHQAERAGASDIHLQMRGQTAEVSFRLDGVITPASELPTNIAELGGRQIITVEDPAEQIVPGIMQTEVNEARGLDFAKAARHLLRQDPQVLVIGEIRDEETANIAVRAALTGHLVISTLHAGSCKGVVEPLLVLCKDHSAGASSVGLVLDQRLVTEPCGASLK